MIQQQDQADPIKFEVHIYHPTAMANAVTPTSWFYTLYVHTPSSIVQRDNPSRLEIAFLLDSGASISVLNYSTYITLTKLLDIRSNHTSDVGPTRNSKTLTVANQTEVPIVHYANIILNTTIDENSLLFSTYRSSLYPNTTSLAHHSLKTIYKIQTYKTLHSNLNTNQKHTQIMQSSQHSYPKIIHTSFTFIDLIQKLKYV